VTLFILIVTAAGQPYNEDSKDYDDYENSNIIENDADKEIKNYPTPKFTSESHRMLPTEGETLRLPCLVDDLTGFVLMWKKNGQIITVQHQVIDQRYRLEDLGDKGNFLILSQVSPEDEGNYTCAISAYNPTEIVHEVTVRIAPVFEIDSEESIIIIEGDNLDLSCHLLAGKPKPQLKWVYQDDEGEVDVESTTGDSDNVSLSLNQVTRDQAGTYTCVAPMSDLGFVDEKKSVYVNVEYPPSIEISEAFIVSDMAEQQEIKCTVLSYPPVIEVEWTHSGQLLTQDTNYVVMTSNENEFTLTIPEVNTSSTGKYTCTATNSVGSDQRSAVVSGEAEPVIILNEESQGDQEDRFKLNWSVASRSEVDRWVVGLRKSGDTEWEYSEVETPGNDSTANATENHGDDLYMGELEFTGLKPGTKYEVTVATSNSFGLGQHGDLYTFSTKQIVKEQEKPKDTKDVSTKSEKQHSVQTSSTSMLTPILHPLIISLCIACVASKL